MSGGQETVALQSEMKFLDKSQVAEMIGVCVKTIDRHVDAGTFPKPDFHIGRQPRWGLETIAGWIESQRRL